MPETENKSVTVKILGTEYGIKSEEDPDYIVRIARYVDQKMKEISDEHSIPSSTKIAILTALDIADELFQERERRQKLLLELESRTAKVVNLIEKKIKVPKKNK